MYFNIFICISKKNIITKKISIWENYDEELGFES